MSYGRLWCLVAGTLLALVLTGCSGVGSTSPSPSSSPSLAASVNGVAVTDVDVDLVQAEARLAGSELSADEARSEAIRRELVRQEAARRDIVVRPADVAERVTDISDQLGGESALSAALSAADMTAAQLDAATEYNLLESALQDDLFPDVQASAEEVRAFYRKHRIDLFTTSARVKLRSITLPSRQVAENVADRVHDGLAFSEAARRYSQDKETRASGGLLGWVSISGLPEAAADAIADTPTGSVSAPVQLLGRWHLYAVLDRKAATAVPFSGVSAEIATELTRRARAAALAKWLTQAEDNATIVVH
ncbi:MAG: peptidylprolyl isomerase [Thermoleophilia bacterium]